MEKYNIIWNRHDEEKEYVIGTLIHAEFWSFFYNRKVFDEAFDKGFRPFPEFPDKDKYYVKEACFKTFESRLNNDIVTDNIKCKLETGDYSDAKRNYQYTKNRWRA